MYTILTDPHTHTIASGHAFSTLEENASAAAGLRLEAIGLTDHYGPMFTVRGPEGRPIYDSVLALDALPRRLCGVRILAGVELDIVDFTGNLYGHDIETPMYPDGTLLDLVRRGRELTIASVHMFHGVREATVAQGTAMYCRALETPGTHIIGHPGRAGVPFDIPEVLQTARRQHKMIEINNHSMHFGEKVQGVCRQIVEACAAMGVQVTVSSDAHSSAAVGDFSGALAMLDGIGFPEGLIANRTLDTLTAALARAGNA